MTRRDADTDLRCRDCHKLIARLDGDCVVVRCARCKSEIRLAITTESTRGKNPRSSAVPGASARGRNTGQGPWS